MLRFSLDQCDDDIVVLDGVFTLFGADGTVESTNRIGVILTLVTEDLHVDCFLREGYFDLLFLAFLPDVFQRQIDS